MNTEIHNEFCVCFQKITKDEHQSKVDFNVFEGKTVHGVAEHVICQG